MTLGIFHFLHPMNWRRLVPGIILTGVVAEGVHSVLLEAVSIPFPSQLPGTGIVPFLNYVAGVLAVFAYCRLAAPQVVGLRTWQKCLGLSVLLVMLNEVLRLIFIDGIIRSAWMYSFVDHIQGVFAPAAMGTMVVLVFTRTKRWWQQAAAALLIAAVVFFGVKPLVAATFKPILVAMANHNGPMLYPSTSWQLNTAASIGFVEPTVASFVMAALAWPGLSARPLRRAAQFALLLALIRRVLFMPFYYPFYAPLNVPMAMLSAGQFTLEWLMLGFLTALTWHVVRPKIGKPDLLGTPAA